MNEDRKSPAYCSIIAETMAAVTAERDRLLIERDRLRAQRDELLEACRLAITYWHDGEPNDTEEAMAAHDAICDAFTRARGQ